MLWPGHTWRYYQRKQQRARAQFYRVLWAAIIVTAALGIAVVVYARWVR